MLNSEENVWLQLGRIEGTVKTIDQLNELSCPAGACRRFFVPVRCRDFDVDTAPACVAHTRCLNYPFAAIPDEHRVSRR